MIPMPLILGLAVAGQVTLSPEGPAQSPPLRVLSEAPVLPEASKSTLPAAVNPRQQATKADTVFSEGGDLRAPPTRTAEIAPRRIPPTGDTKSTVGSKPSVRQARESSGTAGPDTGSPSATDAAAASPLRPAVPRTLPAMSDEGAVPQRKLALSGGG